MGPDNGRGLDYAAEKTELDAVLASRIFTRAPNLSKILAYVCQKYFDGDAGNIKEYNIAVEALSRAAGFRPGDDSIVRVEFSRLRKRLQQYYLTEGRDHTLELQVPESGYAPRFVQRTARPPENGSVAAPDAEAPAAARVRPIAGYFLVVAAVAAGSFAAYRFVANARAASHEAAANSPAATLVPGDEIRIAVGCSLPKYVDASGRTWLGDRWFEGGSAIERLDRRIFGTLDPLLYQTARVGRFQYKIPVKAGEYEVRLHFAEILLGTSGLESYGEGLRRFDAALNGKPLLLGLDIVSDAGGPNTADEKIFPGITVAQDGFLYFEFKPFRDEALLSGIEILPSSGGRMRPVRVVTGARVHYDSKEVFWGADRYFRGGSIVRRSAPVQGDDPNLYATERWGNFTYSIPVAKGSYTLKLKFAESYFAQPNVPAGTRMFDVFCNGAALLRNFDILQESGRPNYALEKVFRGLKPNAQDKLILSFVPVKDYAILNALELIAE
jgi:hypothetical protein